MRWFWIDRFIEFESGRMARAVKTVSLSEDHLHDHFPGAPVMPGALITEGIAQTGGLLVGEFNQFRERVILAKLARITFHFEAVPGDTLVYTAVVESIRADGAVVTGTSHVGDRLQAEAEIYFAHLDGRHSGRKLFNPNDFLVTLRMLGIYDIGRKPDGSPLDVPPHLLEAERQAAGSGG
jgi:3-hydroxyacyl-[acyl-carrier-protein] dehydratase